MSINYESEYLRLTNVILINEKHIMCFTLGVNLKIEVKSKCVRYSTTHHL